jgi:hypothetical protein
LPTAELVCRQRLGNKEDVQMPDSFIAGALTGALAGGGILGGLFKVFLERKIGHAFDLALQARGVVGSSELDYRKQQIEQFYGPIYAMLKTTEEMYELWMGRKLDHVNQAILDHLRKTNLDIRDIIIRKAHLIDGAQIPPVFERYMTCTTIWNFYTSRPGQREVPPEVASLEQMRWPTEFQQYIFETTERLKARLNRLYDQHQID